ncbi:MAG: DNA translocase FtsK 4TM domain-containing protein, partial [Brevinema sp.]
MFKGIIRVIVSYMFILFSILLSISLVGFSFSDLMFFSTNFNINPQNLLGVFGLTFGAPFALFYGYGGIIWAIYSFVTGINLLFGITPEDTLKQFGVVHALAMLLAVTCALFSNDPFVSGGIMGSLASSKMSALFPNIIWLPVLLGSFLLTLSAISNIPKRMIDKAKMILTTKKPFLSPVLAESYNSENHHSQKQEKIDPIIGASADLDYQIPISRGDYDPNLFGADDEYVYIEEKVSLPPTPEFLKNSLQDEDWNQDPLFLTKKRLSHSVEPSFLREVDIDLLSPYRQQSSSSFYDKVSKAQHIDDEIAELDGVDYSSHTDLSTAIDEMESSAITKNPLLQPLSFNRTFEEEISEDQIISHQTNDEQLEQKDNSEDSHEESINTEEESLDEIDESLLQHQSKFPPAVELAQNKHIILPEITDDLELAEIKNDTEPILIEESSLSDSELLLIEGFQRTQERKKNTQDLIREKLKAKQEQLAKEYHEQFADTKFDMGDLSGDLKNLRLSSHNSAQDLTKDSKSQESLVQEVEIPKQISIDSNVAFKYLQDEISELKKAPSEQVVDLEKNPFEDMISEYKNTDHTDEEEHTGSTAELQKELMIFTDTDHLPSPDLSLRLEPLPIRQESFPSWNSNKLAPKKDIEKYPAPELEPLINLDLPHTSDKSLGIDEPLYEILEQKPPIPIISDEVSLEQKTTKIEDLEEEDPFTHYTINKDSIFTNLDYDENIDVPQSLVAPKQSLSLDSIEPSIQNIENSYKEELNLDIVSEELEKDDTKEIILDNPEESDLENMTEHSSVEYETVALEELSDLITDELITVEDTNIQEMMNQNEITEATIVDDDLVVNDSDDVILHSIIQEPLSDDLDSKSYLINEEQALESKDIDSKEADFAHIVDLEKDDASLLPKINTEGHLVSPLEFMELEDESFDKELKEIHADISSDTSDEDPELQKNTQDLYPEHESSKENQLEEHNVLNSKEYQFPHIESLEPNTDFISKEEETREIEETMKMIEDTYESFNINMQVIDYSRGPTITRFEMEPPSGLKLRTILNLQDDLALQAGTSNIRIISPVEGRSCIGIEVPNKIRHSFLLREQIESVIFQESQAELPLILGVDVAGKEI